MAVRWLYDPQPAYEFPHRNAAPPRRAASISVSDYLSVTAYGLSMTGLSAFGLFAVSASSSSTVNHSKK